MQCIGIFVKSIINFVGESSDMEFNQVILFVQDMLEVVQFYLILGFIQIVDMFYYVCFSCFDGDFIFLLLLDKVWIINFMVIYFEYEVFDEFYEVLFKKGIVFE